MVKKLIKYDFRSYMRLLLPVQLIVIGFALINRFIQLFEPSFTNRVSRFFFFGMYYGSESTSKVYDGIFTSSLVLYFISIAVCLLMTVIVAIVRFYQGMYSNEGYLSHTLPVTASQHITAKLLTSILFTFGSLLAVFLSFMLITVGELNIEIFKAAVYLLGKLISEYGFNIALYILEFAVLIILYFFRLYLKLYCCLSVGQLAKKRKILSAFGVFFGIYVVKQIISTVFIIMMTVNLDLMERIGEWISDHYVSFFHILFCGGILFYAIVMIVYFFVNRYMMSKRLNLT